MRPVTKDTIIVYSRLLRSVCDAELLAGQDFEAADRLAKLAAAWATEFFVEGTLTSRILAKETGKSEAFKLIASGKAGAAME